MAWETLSVATYKLRFSSTESAAVIANSTDTAAADANILEFLREVRNEILSRVNKCRLSRGLPAVSPPGLTVPAGSVRHAYTIAQSMQATIKVRAVGALQGEQRDEALRAAKDYLDDIASCDVDNDDAWADQFAPACATSAPVFGGNVQMDFVGPAAGGYNAPRVNPLEPPYTGQSYNPFA